MSALEREARALLAYVDTCPDMAFPFPDGSAAVVPRRKFDALRKAVQELARQSPCPPATVERDENGRVRTWYDR